MPYRYFAWMYDRNQPAQQPLPDQERQLRAMHLKECVRTSALSLHVSEETPTLQISDTATVIGHLFTRDGVPITRKEQLPHHLRGPALRCHIVDHCWGAYLLIQSEAGGLSIMRDPEGGMPCLQHVREGARFITSDLELATLLGTYRKRLDWDAITHRLLYPDIKTAATCLDGIHELLPGTRLAIDASGACIEGTWSPWHFMDPQQRHTNIDEAASAVRAAVETSTRSWAAADRSILLELSGGLDSSIVGFSLKGSSASVACNTLVTPVPGADERRYAGLVATLLGSDLHSDTLALDWIRPDFRQQAPTATPRIGMLQHATDTLMEQSRRLHGAASFFSGGGGDTVFSYITSAAPAADAFRQMGVRHGVRALRDLAELHQCTIWKAGRLALRKLRRPPPSPYKPTVQFLMPSSTDCKAAHHPWLDAPTHALPGERERVFALATTQVYRDSAPRGQLAHLRVPLLSQPVMEATLRVPSWMWIAGGRNRAVARRAFADVLPPDILHRRSKGSFTGHIGALYARHRH